MFNFTKEIVNLFYSIHFASYNGDYDDDDLKNPTTDAICCPFALNISNIKYNLYGNSIFLCDLTP